MNKIQKITNIQLPKIYGVDIKYLLPKLNSHNVSLDYIIKTHSSWFLEAEILTQELNKKAREIINSSNNVIFLGLNRSWYKNRKWWANNPFFWQNITAALLKIIKKYSTQEEYEKIFDYYKGIYITDIFKGYFFVNWEKISNSNEFIKRLEKDERELSIKKTCKHLLIEELKTLDVNEVIIAGGVAYYEFKKMFQITREDTKLSDSVLTNNFDLYGRDIHIYKVYHYGASARDKYRSKIYKQFSDIAE